MLISTQSAARFGFCRKTKTVGRKRYLRRSYDSLGGARFADDQVELYDVDGSLLMKLPLQSADVSRALKGATQPKRNNFRLIFILFKKEQKL